MNAYLYYLDGYLSFGRYLSLGIFFRKVLKNSSVNNKMKREASKFSLRRKVTCFRVDP